MRTVLDSLLRLWTEPLPEGEAAAAAFREVYADPFILNGVETPVAGLVERARSIQRAFASLRIELLDRVDAPGKVVIVMRQRGQHVGPLATPLGEVAPTGRAMEAQVIDVLTISAAGLITEIRMVADSLGMLMHLGAVELVQKRPA